MTLGSATLTTGNDNTSTAFSGTMFGIGGLTKIGAGTLTVGRQYVFRGHHDQRRHAGGIGGQQSRQRLGHPHARRRHLAVSGGLTSNRAVTLSLGGGTFDTNGNSATLGGTLSGIGGLTKIGVGTLTLSGANSYFGGTTINGGKLAVSADNNLGAGAGDLAFGGGTLQYLAGFSSNRAVTLNAGGGSFDTNSNNATLGGTLSGIGGLTKVGAGTLTLSGVGTYAGATTVSAGTLQVDGLIASPSGVSVSSGATLSGNGIVSATTINNGGTLAPGDNAVGALTIAGNLAFQSGASYLVQVSPTAASTTFVIGSTTINAGATLTANSVTAGGYSVNRIFPVLTSTGALTGTFPSPPAQTGNFGGVTSLRLENSPHEVFLIVDTGGGAPPAWSASPLNSNWNNPANWTTNPVLPGATDIAQFNTSTITTIDIRQANTQVGALQFNAGAPAYTFNITGNPGVPSSLVIQGDGVADISGNAPSFVVSGVSGAPGTLQFNNSSTADDAIITTNAFGQTIFTGNSTGGFARFITNAGGVVDFSGTTGPAGNNRVTVGSIEGAGTYNLGSDMLIVGINGLSTTVSGTINDGGRERRRRRCAGQARRRDADLVGREHLYRPDGGPGRHAAGRGDQCLRTEQRVHGRGRRHPRSRRASTRPSARSPAPAA